MEGFPELARLWSLSAQSPDCPQFLYHQMWILSLVIHKKDWQESLKAIILMIMAYYREKIHIKISQRKRSIGQTLEESWMLMFLILCVCVTILVLMCDSTRGELATRKLVRPQHPKFLLGLHSAVMVDWLHMGLRAVSKSPHPMWPNLLLSVMWLVFLVWSAPIKDYQVWPLPPSDPGDQSSH